MLESSHLVWFNGGVFRLPTWIIVKDEVLVAVTSGLALLSKGKITFYIAIQRFRRRQSLTSFVTGNSRLHNRHTATIFVRVGGDLGLLD